MSSKLHCYRRTARGAVFALKRISLSAIILIVSISSMVFAQARVKNGRATDAERELVKINKGYDKALVSGDIAALEVIFGDEFIYTSTSGEVVSKQQQLELFRTGALKIESGVSDQVQVRLYGNLALVLGRFIAKGQFQGDAFESTERYTSVWLKRSGRWQLIAEQGTLVPKR